MNIKTELEKRSEQLHQDACDFIKSEFTRVCDENNWNVKNLAWTIEYFNRNTQEEIDEDESEVIQTLNELILQWFPSITGGDITDFMYLDKEWFGL